MVRRAGWAALAVLLVLAACSNDDDEAAPPAELERATVRVVSQNLLHGVNCDGADACDLAGRVALFARQLEAANCPELVGVQEANEIMVGHLIEASVCDYEVVWDADPGLDREVVLTTLPVLGSRRERLAGPLRTAFWVRVAADVGVVDFVTTHLASGSDDRPCDESTCPPPCEPTGTVNDCQGIQLAAFAEEVAHDDAVAVIGGDFNARPGEPAVQALLDAGFVDTHLAAGNPECDEATGEQCTSGRVDDSLFDLANPDSRQSVRIDYLFVGGSRACEPIDPTGLFNAEPAEGELAYPSDHTGVQATLECPTTEAQQEAAASATVTTAPTTTAPPGAEVDQATAGDITAAFATLFNGDVTDVDAKLAALEDGELLRPYFLESYAAQAEIASRIRVRIDDIRLVDATHADVTYTLLLDDAAVLDHLPGGAVRVGDRWLVSRRTYCDVSTQGATEIPPPCQ